MAELASPVGGIPRGEERGAEAAVRGAEVLHFRQRPKWLCGGGALLRRFGGEGGGRGRGGGVPHRRVLPAAVLPRVLREWWRGERSGGDGGGD